MSKSISLLVSIILLSSVLIFAADDSVTCGSVIKLKHKNSGYRLHSHNLPWGTGSGQQSVTSTEFNTDVNSYFQVKAALGENCLQGILFY